MEILQIEHWPYRQNVSQKKEWFRSCFLEKTELTQKSCCWALETSFFWAPFRIDDIFVFMLEVEELEVWKMVTNHLNEDGVTILSWKKKRDLGVSTQK